MPTAKAIKWIKKREVILKRDDYLCCECKRYGNNIPAEHVHHIHPVEHRPDLEYVNDNLISLCKKCHNSMHNREDHSLTARGERLRQRIAPHL